MRRIRIAYAVITPETAGFGDYADSGWENEEGVCIEPDDFDVDEFGDESAAYAVLAAQFIYDRSSGCEASTYPDCCPGHTWYSDSDGEKDYRDGSETYRSFHLDGFTEDEEHAIYTLLTGRLSG